MPIARLLSDATGQIWTKRAQQEALFDLPERKRWAAADRAAAVADCAAWLVANGVVTESDVRPRGVEPLTITEVRARLAPIADRDAETTGVARDIQVIAPLVGVYPKTLANNLSGFAQAHRLDHRWLLAVARLIHAPAPLGLCLEDRSQAAMMGLLRRVAEHAAIHQLDALDTQLLFSLIALWQRRRPTSAVRANRARLSTRRTAPKPLVRLRDTLILPDQALALLGIEHLGVRALAIEAALTRAHLAPHVDRLGGTPDPPRLLPAIAGRVTGPTPRDTMIRFRIAVMQAWRIRAPWPNVPDALAHHPYVSMTTALARQARGGHLGEAALAESWSHDWAGKAMLAPLIRHRMQTWGKNGEGGRVF